ncbi:PHP-associated domain-containing protein [Anaerocolumna sp. AGMB13025]|uniref:PHP domain-containing protein n=1 Tax=Anaerocolumna sp. AGMB13025 TaxID=3039116 RepID=UPI00241D37CB|nr:PHP domain-containing protein [Anaerocolumna sp. AGMB13025]WFR56814.1 PHP-associated domain-containing protein [Anaerocolumna sp. AGMB13025]
MYKYDTHVHTSETSACASISGAGQVKLYKKLGYDGIIITDHFFNGNTTVPRSLPWKERVERFCLGFEHAYAEGKKCNLSVFFGWEESFQGMDFLVYGLDKDWLLNHPEILKWDIGEHYDRIHGDGGFLVHAHPFRQADYISKIRLYPEYEDGIETINASHTNPLYNQKAIEYAKQQDKPVTGGSDAHHADSVHGGMLFNHELTNIQDFITSVKRKKDASVIMI